MVLSYVYGADRSTLAWKLASEAALSSTGALRLYEHIHHAAVAPSFLAIVVLVNTGSTWLTIAILFRLVYLLRYVRHRAQSKDLAKPHSGSPGDHYWEIVQQRFRDYRGALERWEPKFALRTPTWRYYKRLQTGQPDMFWRGRKLVIEEKPARTQALGGNLRHALPAS